MIRIVRIRLVYLLSLTRENAPYTRVIHCPVLNHRWDYLLAALLGTILSKAALIR